MNTNTMIYMAWITYVLIQIVIMLIMMIVAFIIIKVVIEGTVHIISRLLSSPSEKNTKNKEIN